MVAALSLAELQAFDPGRPARGGREMRHRCPQAPCADHTSRAFSVNIETGAFRCWRCGAAGKMKEFWQEREPTPRGRRRLVPRLREPTPPPAEKLSNGQDLAWRSHLKNVVPLAATPGETYLSSRSIPVELAHDAGTRYSPSWLGRAAVVFPVRDQAGNLVAAQGRYVDDRVPKMRSVGEINLGAFATPGAWDEEPLFLVESPICALTLHAAAFPAIALLGAGNIPAWLPQACAMRRVVIGFDGDAAGDAGAVRLADRLRPLGAKVERFRPSWFKDWNELAPRLPAGLTGAIADALAG